MESYAINAKRGEKPPVSDPFRVYRVYRVPYREGKTERIRPPNPTGGQAMKRMKAAVLTTKPQQVHQSPYIADLVDAFREKDLPRGVYSVLVAHDAWCVLLKNRGPCNCNPDIEIE